MCELKLKHYFPLLATAAADGLRCTILEKKAINCFDVVMLAFSYPLKPHRTTLLSPFPTLMFVFHPLPPPNHSLLSLSLDDTRRQNAGRIPDAAKYRCYPCMVRE